MKEIYKRIDDMNWQLLLTALIMVESGGDDHAIGDNGLAVGCLQIHAGVVDDVNRLSKTQQPSNKFYMWPRDMHYRSDSTQVCRIYLQHYSRKYASKTRKEVGYEEMARIWNGGYKGALTNPSATDNYWYKVRRELLKLGVKESEL